MNRILLIITVPEKKRAGLDMEERGRRPELGGRARNGAPTRGTAGQALGFIRVEERTELADAAVNHRPFRLEAKLLLAVGINRPTEATPWTGRSTSLRGAQNKARVRWPRAPPEGRHRRRRVCTSAWRLYIFFWGGWGGGEWERLFSGAPRRPISSPLA